MALTLILVLALFRFASFAFDNKMKTQFNVSQPGLSLEPDPQKIECDAVLKHLNFNYSYLSNLFSYPNVLQQDS